MKKQKNYLWLIPFFLGLLLPGWGQIYNGKVKQGVILAILFPVLMICIIMTTLHFSNSISGNRFGLALLFLLYMGVVFQGTLVNYFNSPQRSSLPVLLISALVLRYAIHEPLRLFSKSFLVHSYTIPSESMLRTLWVGDVIVSNSSVYRLGDNIKTDDVLIFKNIVDKDHEYVKRVIAGPGDTISVNSIALSRNGEGVELLYSDFADSNNLPSLHYSFIIPRKEDFLDIDTLSYGDFLFHYNLISQEDRKVTVTGHIYLFGSDRYVETIDLDTIPHLHRLEQIISETNQKYRYLNNLEWKPYFFIDGIQKYRYQYQYDSYFLVGDNRGNSYDSRYFGPVSSASVLSRAEMVLFSLPKSSAEGNRFSRIGKSL